jgi:hypothetical protein
MVVTVKNPPTPNAQYVTEPYPEVVMLLSIVCDEVSLVLTAGTKNKRKPMSTTIPAKISVLRVLIAEPWLLLYYGFSEP